MIERTLEKEIPSLIEYFPCVGILGSRQVGKTTFVKHLKKVIESPVLYLDLEDTNDYEKLKENAQWFLEQHADKLIIIDEIQRELSLFPLLRALIDKTSRPGQFILLGSASPELLSKSSETLAGRIVYREITPLNTSELGPENLKKHWLRGGYPKAFLAPNNRLWMEWHQAYLRTYIETDLRTMGINITPNIMSRMLRMLASIQGSLLNYSSLANAMDLSSPTIKQYIDILEHSYVIRRLEPFYVNVGKRIIKSPKIYLRDTGILHNLMSFYDYDALISHPLAGLSWEGFVIEQIASQLNSSCTPYFYRTQTGAEIDLCITKGQQIVASIEIKLSNQPKLSRGNTESIKDLESKNNFIVVFDTADYALNPDWQVCDLYTLIQKLKQLNLMN